VDDAMAAVRAMGDVIIKPLFGSMGHGMVRVSDPETAFRVIRALDVTRSVFYVQRVIDHDGADVRAFVVGDRVVAAIERRANDGGWRTNISLGGDARAIELPPDWCDRALRAARAVGADYAASTSSRRAMGRSTRSRSTASPDGPACSRRRRSMSPVPSSITSSASSTRDRHAATDRHRRARAAGLPAGGDCPEAGQRVAARRLRRHDVR
jgi:hypothetical protein